MFEPTETSNDKIQDKYSPFVEVKHNGKVVYVRKTTLVWIFQQAECVSTDRLYRVRNKQPYSTTLGQESKAENSNSCHGDIGSHDIPQIYKRIEIGDICAFKSLKITHGWRLGEILQFAYLHGKSNKIQQYKGLSVNVGTDVGVLCSWFDWHPPMALCTFSLANLSTSTHEYIPLDTYVCTLTDKCFDTIEASSVENELTSIITTSPTKSNLISSNQFALSKRALSHIEKYIQSIALSSSKPKKGNDTTKTRLKKIKHGNNMDVIS